MIFLVSTHIKWYALVLSQCLKRHLFSHLKCEYSLCNKRLSNETHWISYVWSMLLVGFLNHGLWLNINFLSKLLCLVLCPKLQVKFLHKNHAFNALHNYSIGFFHNAILLWWIWSIFLLFDSTFTQEGIKIFENNFFDIDACFVFHQHIIYFEYFKHLSFGFQRIKNVYFLWMRQNIMFHHGLFKTYLPRPKPTFLPTNLIN